MLTSEQVASGSPPSSHDGMGQDGMGWVAMGSAAAVLGAKRLILAPSNGKGAGTCCFPTREPAFLGLVGRRLLQTP